MAGLASGMAACLLIFEYVAHERSYDRFNRNAARVVRIQDEEYQNGKLNLPVASAMPSLAKLLTKDFPEIEAVCRLYKSTPVLINPRNNALFEENKAYYTDSSVFQVLDVRLTEGNAATALVGPNKLALSASAAKKYFGAADPLGQTLMLRDRGKSLLMEVAGVFADYPPTSHLRFDLLVSFGTFRKVFQPDGLPFDPLDDNWRWTDFYTYVLLRNTGDATNLDRKLPSFIDRHFNSRLEQQAARERFHLTVMPLTDIHLLSHYIQEAEPNGDFRSVTFLFLIGFFILGIAWVNYSNLAAARSLDRAREVGIRKVLGAQRSELIRQFMVESLILNGAALVVAVPIVYLLNTAFGRLTGRPLGIAFSLPTVYWLKFAAVFFTGTCLSGLYPSLVLSGYRPLEVLKGRFKSSVNGQWVRKILIVGQFAASIILIAGTIIVYRQVEFMRRQNLGANIDRTIVLKGASGGLSDTVYRNRLHGFENELRELSGVKYVANSSNVPGEENLWSFDWEWQNNPNGERKEETMMLGIDYDFVPEYDIKVIAGRNFFRGNHFDHFSVLLNESAVRSFGFPSADSAIGKRVGSPTIHLSNLLVVGVVADFHQEGLQKPIRPLVLWLERDGGISRVSIKMAGTDPVAVVSAVKKVWERDYPEFPFEYFFLDDFFDRQYAENQRFGEIFGLFALFAIGIACFGLLGLSAFNVLQRAKEISIRKVLGASVPGLVYLLTADYFFLVGIAVVIAVPVTWIAMDKWLQGFAFRLPIGWWVFALAAIAAVFIAGCTVGAQVWRAARANPVTNLNAE